VFHWMVYAGIAIVMWGLNGLFMKLGTNRASARSMVIWVTVGFTLLLPFLWAGTGLAGMNRRVIFVGLLAGAVNGLGNWAVFACLEKGAKASVAIPLTALYPLCTIALATVFLRERPSALQWLGIGLALVGGAMLSYETAPVAATEAQLHCSR
jgi:bacterial/archaeal transporter family protein